MKAKKLVIGNWKMNPQTMREARAVFMNIKAAAGKLRNVQTVIAASYVHVPELSKLVSGHRCVIGAQDVSEQREGAYTGEVSALQLDNIGATYGIVGHSERRAAGDTDAQIAAKIKMLQKNGITPVLCIGEHERDEIGNYTHKIKQQLLASLEGVTRKNIDNVVIAYEPIWAIGKKATREATPEDIIEISILIRKILTDAYTKKVGENATILYGGSVNPGNTEGILVRGGVQGLLVGRASLDPKAFTSILKTSNNV